MQGRLQGGGFGSSLFPFGLRGETKSRHPVDFLENKAYKLSPKFELNIKQVIKNQMSLNKSFTPPPPKKRLPPTYYFILKHVTLIKNRLCNLIQVVGLGNVRTLAFEEQDFKLILKIFNV